MYFKTPKCLNMSFERSTIEKEVAPSLIDLKKNSVFGSDRSPRRGFDYFELSLDLALELSLELSLGLLLSSL